jgi:hypothetical protein
MGRHATGGGAVFSVGWSVYNRVLRKKLIGLFCGDCEERQIQYVGMLYERIPKASQ